MLEPPFIIRNPHKACSREGLHNAIEVRFRVSVESGVLIVISIDHKRLRGRYENEIHPVTKGRLEQSLSFALALGCDAPLVAVLRRKMVLREKADQVLRFEYHLVNRNGSADNGRQRGRNRSHKRLQILL